MKKFLISLLVGFVGLISFSNALNYMEFNYSQGEYDLQDANFSSRSFTNNDGALYCFVPQLPTSSCTDNICATIYVDNDTYQIGGWENMYCVYGNYITITSTDGQKHYFYVRMSGIKLKNFFPDYTSEQCQSEYSLMPIDSCNSEYCEMNNLCEVIGGSGSSTLYINDIWHESAPFIYVNIPEEFKRSYLTGVQEFTINVEGLNGDADYIQGIIDVNSYRPTSEDFTQTFVGGLTLIFPYIIITAVILFIRRFIRKIFK